MAKPNRSKRGQRRLRSTNASNQRRPVLSAPRLGSWPQLLLTHPIVLGFVPAILLAKEILTDINLIANLVNLFRP